MVLKYGLLGQGISYSLSPKIHTFSSEVLGIDIEYGIIDLNPTQVQRFLKGESDGAIPSMHGFQGFNVTVPYKETVAKRFGADYEAVNCVIQNKDSTWKSTNTDGEGFLRSLSYTNQNWQSIQELFVLGFGGAIKGILKALVLRFEQADFGFKPKRVSLFRRTCREQEEAKWIKRFADYGIVVSFHEFSPDIWEKVISSSKSTGLVIQGTDAPRKGDSLERYVAGLGLLPKQHYGQSLVVDLMYGTVSDLIAGAKDLDIPSTDGLPMLIEQARLAQILWWGKCASFKQIKEALS